MNERAKRTLTYWCKPLPNSPFVATVPFTTAYFTTGMLILKNINYGEMVGISKLMGRVIHDKNERAPKPCILSV